MKNLFLLLFLPFAPVFGQTFSTFNQTHLGTSDWDNLSEMVRCQDGGYLFVANTTGSDHDKTQANFGDADVWVVRLNANKTIRWEKSFGGALFDSPVGVVESTTGSIYILCESASGVSGNKTASNYGSKDYWLLKLDANGAKVWDKSYGSTDMDFPTSLVQLEDNRIVLVGISDGGQTGTKTTNTFGTHDIWVISIDTNGVEQWQYNYGGTDSESSIGCKASKLQNNNLVFTATSYSGVSGNKTSTNNGWEDAWIVEANFSNGQIVHQLGIGGSTIDILSHVLQKNNQLFVVGSSRSDVSGNKTSDLKGVQDAWMLTLASDFTIVDDITYGGTGYASFSRIVPTSQGFVVAGGAQNDGNPWATGGINGTSDSWIVGFTATGAFAWNTVFGSNDGSDIISDIVEISHNYFAFSFLTNSVGMNGDLTQSNYGGYDFYLIEMTTDLGMEEAGKTQLQIHPNPASDHVDFHIMNPSFQEETVLIYSQDGKLIETLKFDSGSTKLTWYPQVVSGIYFYQIGEQTGKIVLNR